jgi:CheY-like chemotaxis protein
MLMITDFNELVAAAYQHLYDFVYLRTHPLVEKLIDAGRIHDKERGWHLHTRLLEAIEELDPGPNAPPYSREWRRHRLMSLRYIDGLERQQVADQLAISRRQYYREHAAAMDAVAGILWDHYQARVKTTATAHTLLQEEIARVARHEHDANLHEVVRGALSLLQAMLQERHIRVRLPEVAPLPPVMIGHNVLRQVLLGVLGFLIDHLEYAAIDLQLEDRSGSVRLLITADLPLSSAHAQERIAPFQEMLDLQEANLTAVIFEQRLQGFELTLHTDRRATILVVDDNEDMLALYEHYLIANRYQVIRADRADRAIDMALKMQPTAVILDLMMPDQDGWEVLRCLSTQPETAHIPIIICSVLKQRELALTLGADAFLEKPINETDLLAALDALESQA